MPNILDLTQKVAFNGSNLYFGSSGPYALAAKKRLFELGMYDKAYEKGLIRQKITELKYPSIGNETIVVVKLFQSESGLVADGIIGPLTWAALFDADVVTPEAPASGIEVAGFEALNRFSASIRNALIPELQAVSELRRAICLDALQYAIDPYNPGQYPRSLYIRGGNLYNTDLTANVITFERIKQGARRQLEFYDGGREAFMLEVVDNNPDTTGGDCSGGIVGLGRKHGVFTPKFDANADTLRASHSKLTTDPTPGDWHWKPGHIGLYVGSWYTVEWVGGAYGCQITKDADRRVYNYLDDKVHKFSAWEEYRKPKKY